MDTNGTEKLSAYLDGELSADEAAAVEARLARDPELRRLLEELRAVKTAAAAQPDVRAPDLWEGIRHRIGSGRPTPATAAGESDVGRRRRLMVTLPQLAAAAGIVLLLGVSLGRLTGPAATADGERVALELPATGETTTVANYASFVEDLEARLEAGRDVLEPGTARVLEESLAKIDVAIAQARTALENDPNNVYLNQHLASARSRKLRLLEDATALIASRT